MCFRLSLILMFWLLTGVALAQSQASSLPDKSSVQELLERVERLERRVSELEENERKLVTTEPASTVQQTAPPVQSVRGTLHPFHTTMSRWSATPGAGGRTALPEPPGPWLCRRRFFGHRPKGVKQWFQHGTVCAALRIRSFWKGQLLRGSDLHGAAEHLRRECRAFLCAFRLQRLLQDLVR